ncbi:MAG: sulfurtransferase-like selenium metabolism protein YedF [Deltaproteobacteria bacterium CG07_land_8_20_14_0_80_60_11]|nr:MAG: sulfurtransferase-like selenium metabolism protein YedF [Deltaproteobacteria bacterium CG07_land_8_20_14_0_80_60_11]
MAEKTLDCRGLACPNPVIKTKELIDRGDVRQLTVLVDNPAAQENVSRFLQRAGFQVSEEGRGDNCAITGSRAEAGPCEVFVEKPAEARRKILVLIGADRLGRGDELLGTRLMANFIATLKEMGPELWCVVLLNAGVKLAVAGSEVLAGLRNLEQSGVRLLVCGTCLNHFQLLSAKQVGETTNMLDIVTSIQLADKVITLT